jgi:hypothetical protein
MWINMHNSQINKKRFLNARENVKKHIENLQNNMKISFSSKYIHTA